MGAWHVNIGTRKRFWLRIHDVHQLMSFLIIGPPYYWNCMLLGLGHCPCLASFIEISMLIYKQQSQLSYNCIIIIMIIVLAVLYLYVCSCFCAYISSCTYVVALVHVAWGCQLINKSVISPFNVQLKFIVSHACLGRSCHAQFTDTVH